MIELFLTYIALVVMFIVRSEVAYAIKMRALEMLDQHEGEWMAAFRRYRATSYHAILFDIRIWTTRQAYPWLFEEEQRSRA